MSKPEDNGDHLIDQFGWLREMARRHQPLTLAQAAKVRGVSPQTMYRHIKKGIVPRALYRREGLQGHYKFDALKYLRWLEGH
jgi:hypothetical protein